MDWYWILWNWTGIWLDWILPQIACWKFSTVHFKNLRGWAPPRFLNMAALEFPTCIWICIFWNPNDGTQRPRSEPRLLTSVSTYLNFELSESEATELFQNANDKKELECHWVRYRGEIFQLGGVLETWRGLIEATRLESRKAQNRYCPRRESRYPQCQALK